MEDLCKYSLTVTCFSKNTGCHLLTSVVFLAQWYSFPQGINLGCKYSVQDSQISLGEMTEDKKKLFQEHTEEVTAGGLITERGWTMGKPQEEKV